MRRKRYLLRKRGTFAESIVECHLVVTPSTCSLEPVFLHNLYAGSPLQAAGVFLG